MDIFAPLGKALRVSSAASTFIGGGFALLAAAIYLAAYLKDADAASTDPWRVAVYLLGFAVAILALSGLSVMARSLLAWLFTLLLELFT